MWSILCFFRIYSNSLLSSVFGCWFQPSYLWGRLQNVCHLCPKIPRVDGWHHAFWNVHRTNMMAARNFRKSLTSKLRKACTEANSANQCKTLFINWWSQIIHSMCIPSRHMTSKWHFTDVITSHLYLSDIIKTYVAFLVHDYIPVTDNI